MIKNEGIDEKSAALDLKQRLTPDTLMIAHNCQFDESCLRAVFEKYVMDYPEYEFYCTCRASRRKLKGVLPNHQLHTVAAYCGYDLTKHHNALADAEACAAIALELL